VLPALVINEARDRLAATFSYEMRELQRRPRAVAVRGGSICGDDGCSQGWRRQHHKIR
jgi:hypothetical protein